MNTPIDLSAGLFIGLWVVIGISYIAAGTVLVIGMVDDIKKKSKRKYPDAS